MSRPYSNLVTFPDAGEPFSLHHLSDLVRVHVDAALSVDGKPGKRGVCQLFRHTMATLMLDGGADIRYIQEMLGHADLKTTQIYAQVSIRQLKKIHTATHSAQTPPERAPVNADVQDIASSREDAVVLLVALAAEASEDPEDA